MSQFSPFSLIYFLSSKRPNTHSNHDMALSYLIFPFSKTQVTPSRQGKQIVLEYRYELSTRKKEQQPTRSPYQIPLFHQSPTRRQPHSHREAKSYRRTANPSTGRQRFDSPLNRESHRENQCLEEEEKLDRKQPLKELLEEDWSISRPASRGTRRKP